MARAAICVALIVPVVAAAANTSNLTSASSVSALVNGSASLRGSSPHASANSAPAEAVGSISESLVAMGCTASYAHNCNSNPTCCEAGFTCYQKTPSWSACLKRCQPGVVQPGDNGPQKPWTCKVMGGSGGGAPPQAPGNGGWHGPPNNSPPNNGGWNGPPGNGGSNGPPPPNNGGWHGPPNNSPPNNGGWNGPPPPNNGGWNGPPSDGSWNGPPSNGGWNGPPGNGPPSWGNGPPSNGPPGQGPPGNGGGYGGWWPWGR